MAKRKAFPRNPLINDRPPDTLDYCAAVIDYVAHSTSENLPSDSAEFGQYLVLMAVRDALRFETERVAKVSDGSDVLIEKVGSPQQKKMRDKRSRYSRGFPAPTFK